MTHHPGMSPAARQRAGLYNPVKDVITTIKEHIPSLSDEDEELIYDNIIDPDRDAADLALRTCACGMKIDGYYAYVDHLITVFGGESHLAGKAR